MLILAQKNSLSGFARGVLLAKIASTSLGIICYGWQYILFVLMTIQYVAGCTKQPKNYYIGFNLVTKAFYKENFVANSFSNIFRILEG